MKIKLKIIILVRVIESFFNHSIFVLQNGRLSPPSALPLICVWFLPLTFFGLDLLSYWWLSLTVYRIISTNWTTLWGWFLATDGNFQHCWRVTRSHFFPFWCCLCNHTMSTDSRQQSIRGHLSFHATIYSLQCRYNILVHSTSGRFTVFISWCLSFPLPSSIFLEEHNMMSMDAKIYLYCRLTTLAQLDLNLRRRSGEG